MSVTRRVFEETHAPRDTSVWREAVRRRCVEQARELRRTHHTAIRGSDISAIVRTTCGAPPRGEEEDFELMATLEEEIRAELRRSSSGGGSGDADDEMAQHYVASEIAAAETAVAATEQVLCPFCKGAKLAQVGTIIACAACAAQLDVADGSIGLGYLAEQLAAAMAAHSTTPCAADPSFAIEARFGPQTLVMSCSVCGFFQVVI
jgi:hypothetical protein